MAESLGRGSNFSAPGALVRGVHHTAAEGWNLYPELRSMNRARLCVHRIGRDLAQEDAEVQARDDDQHLLLAIQTPLGLGAGR